MQGFPCEHRGSDALLGVQHWCPNLGQEDYILQMFLAPASQLKTISVLSIIFEDFRSDL